MSNEGLTKNDREALALFKQAKKLKDEGKLPGNIGIDVAPMRVRLAQDVDLSKATKKCKHCHGTGIVGYRVVQEDRIPIICRCVSRAGGVRKDAFDKMTEGKGQGDN